MVDGLTSAVLKTFSFLGECETPKLSPTGAKQAVAFLIVNALFMDKLFNFRKLFRDVALQSNPRHMGSLAVTWVDKLLAKLTILIVNVASAPTPVILPQANASEPIQLQVDNDMVHAAVQLPGNGSS